MSWSRVTLSLRCVPRQVAISRIKIRRMKKTPSLQAAYDVIRDVQTTTTLAMSSELWCRSSILASTDLGTSPPPTLTHIPDPHEPFSSSCIFENSSDSLATVTWSLAFSSIFAGVLQMLGVFSIHTDHGSEVAVADFSQLAATTIQYNIHHFHRYALNVIIGYLWKTGLCRSCNNLE